MGTFTLDQQRRNSKTVYMLYEILPIGPARRLATQQVGYCQTKKINRGGANCSHTHNIILVLAPNEFNIIIRTTTDEFNVIPRTDCKNCACIISPGVKNDPTPYLLV